MLAARRSGLIAALSTLSALNWAPLCAQSVDPDFWGTDGLISAIASSGNNVFIGGTFASVGPCTGGGVPLIAATGALRHRFPKVAGAVYAAVSDGEGGWYIGGEFTAVAGIRHVGLAHLLVDGSVAAWDPRLRFPQNVFALALQGNTLYVGGGFWKPGETSATALGAIDTRTGAFLPWDRVVNGWVYCLAVKDSTVYAGGAIYGGGGSNLAAMDARTGAVRAWAPHANGDVDALAMRGNTLYVAGALTAMNGQPRNHLAALDAQSGLATAWDPEPDGKVSALAVEQNTVLVGGQFSTIGGQPRRDIAALDAETGVPTAWVPGVEFFDVSALALDGKRIYVGGVVASPSGAHEYGVVALHRSGRVAKAWATPTNRPVSVLALDRDLVYAGGGFSSVGPRVPRANLAALDALTGEVTPWDPHPDGAGIGAIAVDRGVVWVGGDFSAIGGQRRSHLAALDARTGVPTAADPSTDGTVLALASNGSLLFAGGAFHTAAGEPRRNLAALDVASGAPTPWDPGADGAVASLAVCGNTVYAGGSFGQVGIDGPNPQTRRSIAAIDATTGTVLPWATGAIGYGSVSSVALGGSALFAAGDFSQVGGQPRAGFAAFDLVTGLVLPWDPGASYVGGPARGYALGVNGSHVYVSGLFGDLLGGRRLRVGVVDDTIGRVIEWDPAVFGVAFAFAVSGSSVYAGGDMWSMGRFPCDNFAAIRDPERAGRRAGPLVLAQRRAPRSVELAQCIPNPAHAGVSIRFVLPAPAIATLAVFDLQGRRVASLLEHEPQSAGAHELSLRTGSWPAGVYLYRLEAGDSTITRKMVVSP